MLLLEKGDSWSLPYKAIKPSCRLVGSCRSGIVLREWGGSGEDGKERSRKSAVLFPVFFASFLLARYYTRS